MSHDPITPPGPPSTERIRAGHEPLEVNVKAVFIATGLTFVFLVVASVAIYAWWHAAMRMAPTPEAMHRPPREIDVKLNPDQPAELRALRAREQQALTTYGWISREAGVVRIPIDQAMQRLVQDGLPPTAPSPPPEVAR